MTVIWPTEKVESQIREDCSHMLVKLLKDMVMKGIKSTSNEIRGI